MRVVLDTSVLVAAARSSRGASNALLRQLADTGIQPAISVPLFAEYRATLLRPEHLCGRTPADVDSFLDYLLSISHLQVIHYRWRPALKDPDDDFVLEFAAAAGCQYIVTHNLRDFRGCEAWGLEPVTPSALLKRLED